MTPREFVRAIDDRLEEGVNKNIGRLSIWWSQWSAELNREIDKNIELGGPINLYNYVIVYWALSSQILDLHKRNGILDPIKIKLREIEREEIKSIILGEKEAEDLTFSKLNHYMEVV